VGSGGRGENRDVDLIEGLKRNFVIEEICDTSFVPRVVADEMERRVQTLFVMRNETIMRDTLFTAVISDPLAAKRRKIL
jgi:hypothetical protein